MVASWLVARLPGSEVTCNRLLASRFLHHALQGLNIG